MPIDKVCIIPSCRKPFVTRDAPGKGGWGVKTKNLRPFRSKTCSKECSKLYCRNFYSYDWEALNADKKEN